MKGTQNPPKVNPFTKLNKFLRQNKKVDIKTVDLLKSGSLEALNWKGVDEDDQAALLKQVKAYQRLARLLDEDRPDTIKKLLKRNLHSSVQIAAIPRQQFMKDFYDVFKDKALMQKVYARARAVRSQVLLRYMNIVQNGQRHTKAVKAIT